MEILREHIKFLRHGVTNAEICKSATGHDRSRQARACRSMYLGAILGYLEDAELQCIWSNNSNSSDQYPYSVNHLIGVLEKINTGFKPDTHSSCSGMPEILGKIKKLVEERESPVTEEHLQYVRRQRKKTRL